jgi:hypothetical protein
MGKLFKSNSSSTSTEVACQPAQPISPKPAVAPLPVSTIAKAPTEPAKPSDWRESWGKVEPMKVTNSAPREKIFPVLTKRADPKPIRIEQPRQPDPLKAPDKYRDLAMQARPSNSKIPDESRPAAASTWPTKLLPEKPAAAPMPPARQVQEAVVVNTLLVPNAAMPSAPPAPNGAMPPAPPAAVPQGRAIQLAANEPNAFWSPEQPAKPEEGKQEKSRNNAFDRESNDPPAQGMPPQRNGMPQMPPMPPFAAMSMMPPPPRGPMMPPRPPMPPSMPADMGVPDALGNAFTLPGTRRPIPADFGGTPQEPNGFDPMVQAGQGHPPQEYGMGMPGMACPPMPYMMAMGPHGPMPINPLMSVPPTMQDPRAIAATPASAPSADVPQLLATLKNSLYPSEREAAIEQLCEVNWREQPKVVEGLMKAAREDPAATVRAASIHAMAHMKVDTAGAVALVRDLKSDRDPRVRQEAEEALSAFGETGIQQASHQK